MLVSSVTVVLLCLFIVFSFLFRDKGSTVRGRRGRMFSLADFDPTTFLVIIGVGAASSSSTYFNDIH